MHYVAKKVRDIRTPTEEWRLLSIKDRGQALKSETMASFIHLKKLRHFWKGFLKRVSERHVGRDIECMWCILIAFLLAEPSWHLW